MNTYGYLVRKETMKYPLCESTRLALLAYAMLGSVERGAEPGSLKVWSELNQALSKEWVIVAPHDVLFAFANGDNVFTTSCNGLKHIGYVVHDLYTDVWAVLRTEWIY